MWFYDEDKRALTRDILASLSDLQTSMHTSFEEMKVSLGRASNSLSHISSELARFEEIIPDEDNQIGMNPSEIGVEDVAITEVIGPIIEDATDSVASIRFIPSTLESSLILEKPIDVFVTASSESPGKEEMLSDIKEAKENCVVSKYNPYGRSSLASLLMNNNSINKDLWHFTLATGVHSWFLDPGIRCVDEEGSVKHDSHVRMGNDCVLAMSCDASATHIRCFDQGIILRPRCFHPVWSYIRSSDVVEVLSDNEQTANIIKFFSNPSDPLMNAICMRGSHYENSQVYNDSVVVSRSDVIDIKREWSLSCYYNPHVQVNYNSSFMVVGTPRAVTSYLKRRREQNSPNTCFYCSQRHSGERFVVGCFGCSVWVVRFISASVQFRLQEDVVGLLQVVSNVVFDVLSLKRISRQQIIVKKDLRSLTGVLNAYSVCEGTVQIIDSCSLNVKQHQDTQVSLVQTLNDVMDQETHVLNNFDRFYSVSQRFKSTKTEVFELCDFGPQIVDPITLEFCVGNKKSDAVSQNCSGSITRKCSEVRCPFQAISESADPTRGSLEGMYLLDGRWPGTLEETAVQSINSRDVYLPWEPGFRVSQYLLGLVHCDYWPDMVDLWLSTVPSTYLETTANSQSISQKFKLEWQVVRGPKLYSFWDMGPVLFILQYRVSQKLTELIGTDGVLKKSSLMFVGLHRGQVVTILFDTECIIVFFLYIDHLQLVWPHTPVTSGHGLGKIVGIPRGESVLQVFTNPSCHILVIWSFYIGRTNKGVWQHASIYLNSWVDTLDCGTDGTLLNLQWHIAWYRQRQVSEMIRVEGFVPLIHYDFQLYGVLYVTKIFLITMQGQFVKVSGKKLESFGIIEANHSLIGWAVPRPHPHSIWLEILSGRWTSLNTLLLSVAYHHTYPALLGNWCYDLGIHSLFSILITGKVVAAPWLCPQLLLACTPASSKDLIWCLAGIIHHAIVRHCSCFFNKFICLLVLNEASWSCIIFMLFWSVTNSIVVRAGMHRGIHHTCILAKIEKTAIQLEAEETAYMIQDTMNNLSVAPGSHMIECSNDFPFRMSIGLPDLHADDVEYTTWKDNWACTSLPSSAYNFLVITSIPDYLRVLQFSVSTKDERHSAVRVILCFDPGIPCSVFSGNARALLFSSYTNLPAILNIWFNMEKKFSWHIIIGAFPSTVLYKQCLVVRGVLGTDVVARVSIFLKGPVIRWVSHFAGILVRDQPDSDSCRLVDQPWHIAWTRTYSKVLLIVLYFQVFYHERVYHELQREEGSIKSHDCWSLLVQGSDYITFNIWYNYCFHSRFALPQSGQTTFS